MTTPNTANRNFFLKLKHGNMETSPCTNNMMLKDYIITYKYLNVVICFNTNIFNYNSRCNII